jgi:hypothetical protein
MQILNKVCPICIAYRFHDLCAAETAALPGRQPLDSLFSPDAFVMFNDAFWISYALF